MVHLAIAPEGAYTDIEHDFIENEPPGLFPSDQTSVWGQVRSVYAAYLQVIANLLDQYYDNLDPNTAGSEDLPEWEYLLNLPAGNSSLTDNIRRANILARFARGPFTRTRRRLIVESFITATFGDPIILSPSGVLLDPTGVPLFSGAGSLAGTYAIRENQPYKKNEVSNSNFETDASTWTQTNLTLTSYDPNTVAAPRMFGTKVGRAVCASTATAEFHEDPTTCPVVAGNQYTLSAYLFRRAGIRQCSVVIQWYTTAVAHISDTLGTATLLTSNTWTRLSVTGTAPPTAAYALVLIQFAGGTQAANDEFYVDGIQFEAGNTPTDYVDGQSTPFAYEVRILNTITVDVAGMTRELTRITPAGISFVINSVALPV